MKTIVTVLLTTISSNVGNKLSNGSKVLFDLSKTIAEDLIHFNLFEVELRILFFIVVVTAAAVVFGPTRRALLGFLGRAIWHKRLQDAFASLDGKFPRLNPQVLGFTKLGSGVALDLALRRGTATKDMETMIPYLETRFRARKVEVKVNYSDRSRLRLIIHYRNPLLDNVVGPDLPLSPLTIWDPIAIGVDETSTPVHLSLFEHNLLLGGEPGSGKSSALQVIGTTVLLDPEAVLYICDPKYVEFSPYKKSKVTVAHSLSESNAVLKEIESIMALRFQFLAQDRLRKWHRNLGSLVFLIIDELPILLNDPDAKSAKEFAVSLRKIVSMGRAAGVVTVVAAQKPSVDSVPSVIRDLIDYRLAFRSATREASDVILGSGQAARGYSATEIDSNLRGVAYLLGGATTDPQLIRCFYLDEEDIAQRLDRAVEFRNERGRTTV